MTFRHAQQAPVRHPKPSELALMGGASSGVVEASAGTGKTYLLEHLVLDLVMDKGIPFESLLVVTFTEKATAELVRRLRSKIDQLLGEAPPPPAGHPATDFWIVDGRARARLEQARQTFDRATISTIHGFCKGVLTEHAFGHRRLFAQQTVDGDRAFAVAFREVLRRELAVSDQQVGYLRAWLERSGSVETLEALLLKCWKSRSGFETSYDPTVLAMAVESWARIEIDAAQEAALLAHTGNRTTVKSIVKRARDLGELARAWSADGDLPGFLAGVDGLVRTCPNLFSYVEDALRTVAGTGRLAPFKQAFTALAAATPALAAAVAQLFLPPVMRRLEEQKRVAGLYDFDDMLSLVAEGLHGPGGPALLRALRERYRYAVIDESQDTDPVQWQIFRRIFFESGGENPVTLIGDPKQAIYGFRGADVHTYLAARDTIVAAGGPLVHLQRNFRSERPLIDAYNRILDQSAEPSFFTGEIKYDRPVTCGQPAQQGQGERQREERPAAVTVFCLQPRDERPLRVADIKRTLGVRIAREIRALVADKPGVASREIFILTRSVQEGTEIGAILRAAGIAHAYYKQDYLFKTDEARDILDLLRAIDDPHQRARRLRAWLTPFFGLGLADLEACAEVEGNHPLLGRLFGWKALAEAEEYGRLFAQILDQSGILRRELFLGEGERRLTNYLHIFELLLAELHGEPCPLGDLTRLLEGFITGARSPTTEQGNVQRLETDGDAVQIMTMHKAKGLEADVVFLYGGLSGFSGYPVRSYHRNGRRFISAGKLRSVAVSEAIKAEQAEEDQRLLYVALTRARKRLYLPYLPTVKEGEELLEEEYQQEVYKQLHGGYRHVNGRLRRIFAAGDHQALFSVEKVPCPLPDDDQREGADRLRALASRLRGWTAPPPLLKDVDRRAEFHERRSRHAGLVITSYSRLKQAKGGYQVPLAEPAPPALADPVSGDQLPGGTLSGIFLHAVLEKVPLETLVPTPSAAAWSELPAIRRLFEEEMRRTDRHPRYLAHAQSLIHRVLTTPLRLGDGPEVPGIAAVAVENRCLREMEFTYPVAMDDTRPGTVEGGYIKGFVDLIFEHRGLTYLADWKSDLLPTWEPDAVTAHVAANYQLQARLYSIALVKMLNIGTELEYQGRFGGLLYFFLRGMPNGVFFQRPSFAEVTGWLGDLGNEVAVVGDRDG
jgi:exodeoxyribonuclease V beta subunit